MKIVYLAPLILAGCAPVIPAPLPPAQPAAAVVRPVPTTPAVQTQALKPKPKISDRVPVIPKPRPDLATETPAQTSDSGTDTSSDAPQPVATGEKVGTCKEGSWWGLIGRPRSAASIVSEPKRVYTEGDPVTMDNKPERTNIVLDGSGNIAKVTCG